MSAPTDALSLGADDDDRPSLNDRIAAWCTKVFFTMWCAYAFGAYGALGAVFPQYQQPLLYWSNWIQLVALPLLGVGTVVLTRAASRRAERRAEETHAAVMEELALARKAAETQAEEIALLRELVQKAAA